MRFFCLVAVWFFGIGTAFSEGPPDVKREFRAAWVATVFNIDWPSKAGLSAQEQKGELLAILDMAVETRLNAIILQVRPAADALYESKLEPWSPYLTGEMGKSPGYDPLAYAVKEAHRRGLELHAWFNPFRAQTNFKNAVSRDHITRTQKAWIKRYDYYLWLDPGRPEVRRYSIDVIMDVVRRYDIDGVHIDDYFYPYPIKKDDTVLAFGDLDSFLLYGNGKRDDWRRRSINTFVKDLYGEIKDEKEWVKFGISPFGIWRPHHPKQIEAGLDAYSDIYADSRKWLREGWLDYMMPQLYWSTDSKEQAFEPLYKWWVGENRKKRHLWPGIATQRVGGKRPASEMVKQVELMREGSKGFAGHAHWNATSLMDNQLGVRDLLERKVYQEVALVPESRWLDGERLGKLNARFTNNGEKGVHVALEPMEGVRFWLAQSKETSGKWEARILDGRDKQFEFADCNELVVTPVGKTGDLGKPARWERGK